MRFDPWITLGVVVMGAIIAVILLRLLEIVRPF